MGSGKSTVGKLLARALGRPYVDNDEELDARTGRTAREISDEEGLDSLHEQEAKSFEAMLERPEPSVLGAAASVIESPTIRARLRDHDVVWLDADREVLEHRTAGPSHRPQIAANFERRRPLYAEVATIPVDTTHLSVDETVDRILDALQ
jgi:shikimate kinase